MRRGYAYIFIILLSVSGLFVAFSLLNESQVSPSDLGNVRYWAYQLQGIDESGAVDALVASRYDLLVLEPTRSNKDSADFDTAGMVDDLHNTASANLESRIVIAYINIGQAEDWRWYWEDSWIPPTETSHGSPDFLVSLDPDGWEGDYPVAYWDDDWKDILLYGEDSCMQQILDDGFDGIYMDWIEAYDHEPVSDAADAEGLDAEEEMIAFISEIRQYCQIQDPDFILIAQNALSLADDQPEYFNVIDAVAQEHLLFDGVADTDWGEEDSGDIRIPESGEEGYSTEWYVEKLDMFRDHGKTVFVVDYATLPGNVAESYAFADEKGYICFVTQIALSQLPSTTPPDYPLGTALHSVVQFLSYHNSHLSKSLKSRPNC